LEQINKGLKSIKSTKRIKSLNRCESTKSGPGKGYQTKPRAIKESQMLKKEPW
jgi:hypothetical protein